MKVLGAVSPAFALAGALKKKKDPPAPAAPAQPKPAGSSSGSIADLSGAAAL